MNRKSLFWCGLVAILGGFLGIAYGIGFPLVGWEPPGSSSYVAYQNYNRLQIIPLLLQLIALLCFVQHYRTLISRIHYWSVAVFIGGYTLWIFGIVGEFWLFTSEPYNSTLRSTSYAVTGIGFIIAHLALFYIGIIFRRSKFTPRWVTVFIVVMPLNLVAALISTYLIELIPFDPITVQSTLQGLIWVILGLFMIRQQPTLHN